MKEADMSSQTPSLPQDEVGIGLILAVHHFCMNNMNKPRVLKLFAARVPFNYKIHVMPPLSLIQLFK